MEVIFIYLFIIFLETLNSLDDDDYEDEEEMLSYSNSDKDFIVIDHEGVEKPKIFNLGHSMEIDTSKLKKTSKKKKVKKSSNMCPKPSNFVKYIFFKF